MSRSYTIEFIGGYATCMASVVSFLAKQHCHCQVASTHFTEGRRLSKSWPGWWVTCMQSPIFVEMVRYSMVFSLFIFKFRHFFR